MALFLLLGDISGLELTSSFTLDRIERIISRSQGMTRKEAIELAEKKNKLRASYYNFYTDKGWGVASSYDLSIDSSILGSEETAIFIRDFIQKKDGRPKWEKRK